MKLCAALGIGVAVAVGLWLMFQANATDGDGRGTEAANQRGADPDPGAIPEREMIEAFLPRRPGTENPRRPLPSSQPVEPSIARTADLSRGRLVDERTLEPIPDALVATRRSFSRTDADGRFDTGEPLDELAEIDVLNVAHNGSVKEVPRERWTRQAEGWVVPLAIGPTYRLRFLGLEKRSTATWQGRLMRRKDDGERWMTLAAGPLPFLRYDAPIDGPEPGKGLWIEVRSQDGLQEGWGEVQSTIGVQEIDVLCRSRAVLGGRVVDEKGAACSGVEVSAIQLDPNGTQRLSDTTDRNGGYLLSATEPGTMSVVVLAPSHIRPPLLSLPVPRGVTRAPDVTLARGSAGMIRGSVRCRSGAGWIDATVRLRALDGSGFEQVTRVGLGSRSVLRKQLKEQGSQLEDHEIGVAAHGTSGPFEFENVPAGRFELSVSTSQGFPCSPTAIQIAAPAAGVVFACNDDIPLRTYRLRVVDAESLEPVSSWFARVSSMGVDPSANWSSNRSLLQMTEGAQFEWRVFAEGYLSGLGTDRDFVPEGDESTATCALPRGFGARLTVEAWTGMAELAEVTVRRVTTRWGGPVLAGAQILADGVHVATSDERGIAEIELPSEPERIEVRLAGWRVVDSYGFRNGRGLFRRALPYDPRMTSWSGSDRRTAERIDARLSDVDDRPSRF